MVMERSMPELLEEKGFFKELHGLQKHSWHSAHTDGCLGREMHVAPLQSQGRNEVTVKLLTPSFHGMPGWRTFPFALQCLAQWETNESQL